MAKVRGVSANVEMCVWAGVARIWTRVWSPREAMRSSAVLAKILQRAVARSHREPAGEVCARGEVLAWRWVSVLGGDCYDRALAMRWWCATRGVELSCVIGVRRGGTGAIEGHAWVCDRAREEIYLMEEGAGYREVARG